MICPPRPDFTEADRLSFRVVPSFLPSTLMTRSNQNTPAVAIDGRGRNRVCRYRLLLRLR
jgi:hypothetical protein